ncbi:lipopolysaccharide biosynthesis protein [Phycisphaerales bacterium AB-hyl4]|uniref:Lipopolysaccharide biosynthesis protein n=1 Tax=Natronomicrosphaera hydrolytica TaxID=3242702 RepID=A0ABV4U3N0_9BACT
MTRRLLLNFSYLASSQGAAEAMFLVRGMVIARLLGPTAFGIWSAIRLALIFSRFTHIGANTGMMQIAPYAEGAGSIKRAQAHRRVTSAVSLTGALVAASAVVLVGGWVPGEGMRHWWWLAAALIVAQQLMLFYCEALASQREFGWAAAAHASFAALSTVGGVVGALWWGLSGFLLALAGSYLIVLAVCGIVGPGFPIPAWRMRYAMRLVNVGWPIMLGHLLLILLWNIDKVVLWAMRSSEQLGVYAIQSYFTAGAMLLPAVVAAVMHPHLRMRLGMVTDQAAAMRPVLLEGTRLLACVALPMVGLGALLMHLPIRWLLPAYIEAIEPGRLLMLVSFPSIVATLAMTVLVSLSLQRRVIAIRTTSVVVSTAAAVAVMLAGGGLIELAAAVALGFMVHAAIGLACALHTVQATRTEAAALLAVVVGQYVALAMLTPMLLVWIPDEPTGLADDVTRSLLRCAVMLALLAPLGWSTWRRMQPPRTQTADDDVARATTTPLPGASGKVQPHDAIRP